MLRGGLRRGGIAIAVLAVVGGFSAEAATTVRASGPPQIVSTVVENVSAEGATLRASINPEGSLTTYRFEYLTEAAYDANIAASREPFQGAALAPSNGAGAVGSGTIPSGVNQHLAALAPETRYRYRLRAVNAVEPVFSVARPFGTEAPTNVFELLDNRGWEMVSPIEKNGGAIQPPESIAGGGVFQASATGGAITYSSADSFGAGAQGAPAGSQYLASHGEGGWTSSNITTPILSGSYGDEPDGVPFQVFSPDLSSSLLSNGERCRGNAGGECPVANPSLPGSGAPSGFRDYYERGSSGDFHSILTAADLLHTNLTAEEFELRLVAATPGLDHVVLSSCAALAPGATEVAAPGGCSEAEQNLYEWSGGSLSLINLLPGELTGTPGAAIAARSGAISIDGSRVYFASGGKLYLREGSTSKLVYESGSGEAEFQTASSDGGTAYVLDAGQLYSYRAATASLSTLPTGGEVEGVLGASADGTAVYYAEPGGLFLRAGGTTTEIAAGASESDWPPSVGTARVSEDGRHLLFLSEEELTGYPNEGESEVFLYGPPGAVPSITCVSCNPTGERPAGGSTIPGATANGSGVDAFHAYKPRDLSAAGTRVFFDSADRLVPQDSDKRPDVYEWETDGVGTCAVDEGCVQLISTGRSGEASTFLDASADGSDAFFLTSESIYPLDPGSNDIYDARVGGGFTPPPSVIPCDGDACQVLPEAPEDPTPGTLVPNSGNPQLRIAGQKKGSGKKGKHKKHKHGKKKAKHRSRRAK